ncbi:MAG: hypothetical protein H6728_06660 [Myxococcales bacterium]|nr:hypothetical protein [Myxococcales bacterium]MCB9642742.1 hypothetical protein [Myxococcales bacterium]
MNDKLSAKTVTLRFTLGVVGGLGSIFASYAAWNWLGISAKPPHNPPAIVKPADKDGWPKKPNDYCRLYLNTCRKNCITRRSKDAKEDGKKLDSEQKQKLHDNCTEECWASRLQGEARQLCSTP